MKIARVLHQGEKKWVLIDGDVYRVITSLCPWENMDIYPESFSLQNTTFLPPTIPSKIVAVGLNYQDHIQEMRNTRAEEPILFLKPSSALLPHLGEIVYPSGVSRLDYEAELAIILKRSIKNDTFDEAQNAIWGFTICNDVTARDLQSKDQQWTRSKSFDTFCPLGPWLETEFIENNQTIQCKVNNQIKQNSKISNRIWKGVELLVFISSVMTLNALDVVITGTPSGIGPMKVGDVVEATVDGIGTLQNTIVHH